MAWSIFKEGGGQGAAQSWATSLLQAIGAPQTQQNIQVVYDWEVSEGAGGKYNPLNQGPVPGHPELTTTGSQYGGGAADYASWQAGLQGAVDYLNMQNFASIKKALVAGNAEAARAAIIASPWAGSHYGNGASFATTALPGQSTALPGITNANFITGITGGASGIANGVFDGVLSALGISDLKDLAERAALILLGGLLLVIGLFRFVGRDKAAVEGVKELISLKTGGKKEVAKNVDTTASATESE